ncbi:hypothetical protein Tco_0451427 [Tanacetum coccineum]
MWTGIMNHKKGTKDLLHLRSIDSEIMEKKSVIARLNKVSSPDGDYLLWSLYFGALEDGIVIPMLVERRYPLSKDLFKECLIWDWKLKEKLYPVLIRDSDFHEKRMAKQVKLNKKKGKGTGQGENRHVWNNVQRLNHQNKFVPKEVLTKTGIFPVDTARQNLSSQTAATSTARKINTAIPIVNEIRPRNTFYKSHSPIRRPFNKSTAPKANFTNHNVNTAGDKIVSVVRGYRETAVKASVGCNRRPKRHYWNKVSKYYSGSNSNKNVNFKDPLGRPKSAMAWVPKRN